MVAGSLTGLQPRPFTRSCRGSRAADPHRDPDAPNNGLVVCQPLQVPHACQGAIGAKRERVSPGDERRCDLPARLHHILVRSKASAKDREEWPENVFSVSG